MATNSNTTIMQLDFFELKEKPFSMSPDPRFIYLTDQHAEAMAKCEYTIEQKMGLSVIHGDIGGGKTSIARRLWEKYFYDNQYNIAMLVDPNYPTSFQFINEVRRELKINRARRSFGDALNEFQDYLLEQQTQGKTTILFVDEAQTLRPRNFELLRKLLNFETNTEKLLQIVLFGQNELLPRIERVPALKSRVSLFGALSGLTRRDTDDLIRFRWTLAGGKQLPFTDGALDTIYRLTKGNPRNLCKLCDNALLLASLRGMRSIDETLITEAAKDLHLIDAPIAEEGSASVENLEDEPQEQESEEEQTIEETSQEGIAEEYPQTQPENSVFNEEQAQ